MTSKALAIKEKVDKLNSFKTKVVLQRIPQKSKKREPSE